MQSRRLTRVLVLSIPLAGRPKLQARLGLCRPISITPCRVRQVAIHVSSRPPEASTLNLHHITLQLHLHRLIVVRHEACSQKLADHRHSHHVTCVERYQRTVPTHSKLIHHLRMRTISLMDLSKHQQQHEKAHHCNELGCTRAEGFATVNDLDRHKSSVHHKVPSVGNKCGYICAACPPPTGHGATPKFWPRRDNFRAHIRRKHQAHNENGLLAA